MFRVDPIVYLDACPIVTSWNKAFSVLGCCCHAPYSNNKLVIRPGTEQSETNAKVSTFAFVKINQPQLKTFCVVGSILFKHH